MKKFSFSVLFILTSQIFAQITFPSNEASFNVSATYVFKNAVIHQDYQTTFPNAHLVIKGNKILKVTTSEKDIPLNATIIDLKGKHIYPAFIDLYSDFGMPEIKKQNSSGSFKENYIKGAYYWNPAIKSHFNAIDHFSFQNDKADEYRKNGFAYVLTAQKDGIVRGTGALVALARQSEHENIIQEKSAAFFSFKKGSSPHFYPSSLMGSIALLRQSLYDAQWYSSLPEKKETNISLEHLNQLLKLPLIFECSNKWDIFRSYNIAKEFGINFIYKTAGDEYQRINDLKSIRPKLIVPLNFPEPYDVSDPMDADMIPLTDLKHWELAPTNPTFLEKNNIDFAFTLDGVKEKSNFLPTLRKLLKYGISEKTILKALTYNPAQFINADNQIGSLKKNYLASFFITNKNIFDENAVIIEQWILGKPHIFYNRESDNLIGNYTFTINNQPLSLQISGNIAEQKLVLKKDTTTIKTTTKIQYPTIQFTTNDSIFKLSFSGNFIPKDSSIYGVLFDFKNNHSINVVITKKESLKDTIKPKKIEIIKDYGQIYYPFCAYGVPYPDTLSFFEQILDKLKHRYDALLIKDAIVWTNTKDSVLNEYDVYIVDGKIVRIAPNIDAPKLAFAKIIDAKGMHLTPGIIDEHSHIAISGGVNEWTQASSAEVRIGDVINPEDINIYRQLAGGVTTAHLLHGSANPIGGQCQVIKLKWGYNADEMKYNRAKPSIKFALGENVKQGNSPPSDRFPQTRMGVEQVLNDYFHRSIKYQKEWAKYNALSEKEKKKIPPPRKDLELEALVEILENKRNITCHSYVQSEINMLIHLADSLGFKVNTFTHVLEGYKVADKLKKHGATASTFSDWWAYKMEVMEAIPYNAALLTKMGVNTCINSDDAEMGRRLNQEAGKCIKYGGLSPVQALKLVTLNPAKALAIDKEIGTIEVGKYADLVLWTDFPLSTNAKVKYTIIEGKIFYDDEENKKREELIQKERSRIIEKLLKEKKNGSPTQKYKPHPHKLYHCDDVEVD